MHNFQTEFSSWYWSDVYNSKYFLTLVNPISMIDTAFYHILSIYVLNGKTISTEKVNWFNYQGIDNELKTLHFIVKHII